MTEHRYGYRFAVWPTVSTVAGARHGRADGGAPSVRRGSISDAPGRSWPGRRRRRGGHVACPRSTRSTRHPNQSTPAGSPTATDPERTIGTVEQLQLPAEYLTGWTAPTRSTTGIEAAAEIQRMLAAGYRHTSIARSLNARAVPTPTGRGQWWPASVRRHVEPGPWAAYVRRYRQTRR